MGRCQGGPLGCFDGPTFDLRPMDFLFSILLEVYDVYGKLYICMYMA